MRYLVRQRMGLSPNLGRCARRLPSHEGAQRAAHVALDVHQLALDELAAGRQHPLLLDSQRLYVHRLEQAHPHHLGDPMGSLRSDLLVFCAVSKAFVRRVSTHPGLGQTVSEMLTAD